jgi:geranylgeranyl pyrophosphate synthase
MCEAEVEQEFHLAREDDPWEQCVSIARRKTGSLFGLAAFCAAGRDNPELAEALRNAGYAVGTAYQLADDLLDISGDASLAGKTLGTDAATEKLTAASAWLTGKDPAGRVEELVRTSGEALAAWPAVQEAWEFYVNQVITPVVQSYIRSSTAEALA